MSGDSSKITLSRNTKLTIVGSLIVLAIFSRLIPHPPNFAPIAAVALFGGALLPRQLGAWIPLTAMVISDLFIGLHDLVWVTWSAFFIIGLVAQRRLSGNVQATSVLGTTVFASVFFFLTTNFAVWLQGALYPRTLSGLADSYVYALPFFRNTLLGDLFFVGVLFGGYYFAIYTAKHLRIGIRQTSS